VGIENVIMCPVAVDELILEGEGPKSTSVTDAKGECLNFET
jgi:hypothetical protein